MKTIIILSILFFQINAYTVNLKNINPGSARTHTNENEPWDGTHYYFKYETTLGTVRLEEGFLEDNDEGEKSLVQIGLYTTIDDEGQVYLVEYYADESGYNQKSPKPIEDYGKEIPTRLTRMIGLLRLNRDVKDALAGNIVMEEGPVCAFIECPKALDRIKAWRAKRKA